jgi:hypothetical protein
MYLILPLSGSHHLTGGSAGFAAARRARGTANCLCCQAHFQEPGQIFNHDFTTTGRPWLAGLLGRFNNRQLHFCLQLLGLSALLRFALPSALRCFAFAFSSLSDFRACE